MEKELMAVESEKERRQLWKQACIAKAQDGSSWETCTKFSNKLLEEYDTVFKLDLPGEYEKLKVECEKVNEKLTKQKEVVKESEERFEALDSLVDRIEMIVSNRKEMNRVRSIREAIEDYRTNEAIKI